jgi:hypothetical protein
MACLGESSFMAVSWRISIYIHGSYTVLYLACLWLPCFFYDCLYDSCKRGQRGQLGGQTCHAAPFNSPTWSIALLLRLVASDKHNAFPPSYLTIDSKDMFAELFATW